MITSTMRWYKNVPPFGLSVLLTRKPIGTSSWLKMAMHFVDLPVLRQMKTLSSVVCSTTCMYPAKYKARVSVCS